MTKIISKIMLTEIEEMFNYLRCEYFFIFSLLKNQSCIF